MSYISGLSLCPYYQYDKNNILHCEIGEIYFSDKEMRREIGYEYCGRAPDKCPFKIALDNYYKRKNPE